MTTGYRTDLFTDYQPVEYYEMLQVQPGASKQTIEAAYRRMAWQYHPDYNHSEEATRRMQQINAAYATLKDSRRRQAYDQEFLYDTVETETQDAYAAYEYSDSGGSYTGRSTRRVGISFRTKFEVFAILVTLLIIGTALFVQSPSVTAVEENPVTGVSNKSVVSNYPAPVLRTLFYDDFEGAKTGGWKSGNAWHLTTRQAYSGKTSLWVGDEAKGAYRPNLDVTAELLKPVDLTGISHPVLRFRLDGQAGQNPGGPAEDRLLIEAAGPGQAFQPVFETRSAYSHWEEISVDLSKFKGAEINLRVHFISGPGKNITNNTGYYLDDFRVDNELPGR